jgi:undecaprenyl pyrophosphate synthase
VHFTTIDVYIIYVVNFRREKEYIHRYRIMEYRREACHTALKTDVLADGKHGIYIK